MTTFDEVLAMLKRLEWSGNRGDSTDECPICGQNDGYGPKGEPNPLLKHDDDCELMALIRKMESTPMVCRPKGTVERQLDA